MQGLAPPPAPEGLTSHPRDAERGEGLVATPTGRAPRGLLGNVVRASGFRPLKAAPGPARTTTPRRARAARPPWASRAEQGKCRLWPRPPLGETPVPGPPPVLASNPRPTDGQTRRLAERTRRRGGDAGSGPGPHLQGSRQRWAGLQATLSNKK